MEISQKKFSNKTNFRFGEKKLEYTMKDSAGSESFSIEYIAIPENKSIYLERNPWYRNVAFFWVLIGVFVIVSRYLETGKLMGSMWLTLGIVCIVIYWFVRTEYTIFHTSFGRVFVIQDKSHDEIVDQIESRRKAQYRAMYGRVNFDTDPTREIEKFDWLMESGVISEVEYAEADKQIREHHGLQEADTGEVAPKTLN